MHPFIEIERILDATFDLEIVSPKYMLFILFHSTEGGTCRKNEGFIPVSAERILNI